MGLLMDLATFYIHAHRRILCSNLSESPVVSEILQTMWVATNRNFSQALRKIELSCRLLDSCVSIDREGLFSFFRLSRIGCGSISYHSEYGICATTTQAS